MTRPPKSQSPAPPFPVSKRPSWLAACATRTSRRRAAAARSDFKLDPATRSGRRRCTAACRRGRYRPDRRRAWRTLFRHRLKTSTVRPGGRERKLRAPKCVCLLRRRARREARVCVFVHIKKRRFTSLLLSWAESSAASSPALGPKALKRYTGSAASEGSRRRRLTVRAQQRTVRAQQRPQSSEAGPKP